MYVALKLLGAISALDDTYMKTFLLKSRIKILYKKFVPQKNQLHTVVVCSYFVT